MASREKELEEDEAFAPRISLSNANQSAAIRVLEEVGEDGQRAPKLIQRLREELIKLNSLLTNSELHRCRLTQHAKHLRLQLLQADARSEAASEDSPADKPSLLALKQTVDQARAAAVTANTDASNAIERERIVEEELADLQRQRNEYCDQLEQIEREYTSQMEPQIKRLRDDTSELQKEIDNEKAKAESIEKEKTELERCVQEVKDEHAELQKQREEERKQYAEVYDSPERVRKQSKGLEDSLKTLQSQQKEAEGNIKDLESKNERINKRMKQLNDEQANNSSYLERLQIANEERSRDEDQKKSRLEHAFADSEAHKEEQTRLQAELRHMVDSYRQEQEVLRRTTTEKNQMLKRLRKAKEDLQEEQSRMSPLENEKANIEHDIAQLETELKHIRANNDEIRKDVDVHTNEYIKEETFGKERATHVQQAHERVAELENEVSQLRKDEQVRQSSLRELAKQREQLSRLASTRQNKQRELQKQITFKDLVVMDLQNKHKQLMGRLKDSKQLYNLLNNERNKLVNMIQSSSQSIAEMKEKLKALGNEAEILRSESASRDKKPTKADSNFSSVRAERDQRRNELNKQVERAKEKEQQGQELYQESVRLKHVINDIEESMRQLKQNYERQVELRNMRGLTLIDRNDELCILHEKSNMYEQIMKEGEVELKKREDEARALRLEVKEVQRSTDTIRKHLPNIPELECNITSLRNEFHDTRQKAQELSEKVDSPEKSQRYRELGGPMPDKEELAAKKNELEERLNQKQLLLHEKETVLGQVSEIADKLQQQAAESKSEALDFAKRLNEYQRPMREMDRKMKATVSELSMSQATSQKLHDEKAELAQTVDEAKQRLADGLPPTDDAVHELERREEEERQLLKLRGRQEEGRLKEEEQRSESTAQERSTSHVLPELGAPKPFGAKAPSKLQECGANMRHIRVAPTKQSQQRLQQLEGGEGRWHLMR